MKDTFEPYVLKGTRTDLGRERESNLSDLSDRRKKHKHYVKTSIPDIVSKS